MGKKISIDSANLMNKVLEVIEACKIFEFNKNKYSEFDMNISYKHYGKHFDTHSSNFSTIEMDSTDIVNFNLNKKLNNSSVFLRISNLFDENYQRPHGYNQEKRQIRVGLKY